MPPEEERTRLDAVQAVLDQRVNAVVSGDRDGWLATLDPQAPTAFREAQGRHFDGLRSIPLATYRLAARLDDSGDLAVRARTFLPETRMTWRLTGYDDRDAIDSLWWTFAERDGRWYVTADDDLAALGLDTARGPWDFGAVQTIATEHVLVLHHPEQRDRAEALSALAEEAMGVLRQRWDKPWNERVTVVLPRDTNELEALLQSTIDLDKFLAFVSYGAVRDDGWVATAPRLFIQDQNLSQRGRGFQVETLVHELAHAAAAPLAGPQIPAWVHEGVADWVATGRPTGERKPPRSDGVLPRDHEFTTGSQASILTAYRESRSAVSFLSARRGLAAPSGLFERLGSPKVAPGSADHPVDAALRDTTGGSLDLAGLTAGWARR